MIIKHIGDALASLCPNASFMFENETYESVVWSEDNEDPMPSEQEVNQEILRLQAEYDAQQYSRDRADAYPSIQDQLDMQYHDLMNGTTTWKDAIQAVKDSNPKP